MLEDKELMVAALINSSQGLQRLSSHFIDNSFRVSIVGDPTITTSVDPNVGGLAVSVTDLVVDNSELQISDLRYAVYKGYDVILYQGYVGESLAQMDVVFRGITLTTGVREDSFIFRFVTGSDILNQPIRQELIAGGPSDLERYPITYGRVKNVTLPLLVDVDPDNNTFGSYIVDEGEIFRIPRIYQDGFRTDLLGFSDTRDSVEYGGARYVQIKDETVNTASSTGWTLGAGWSFQTIANTLRLSRAATPLSPESEAHKSTGNDFGGACIVGAIVYRDNGTGTLELRSGGETWEPTIGGFSSTQFSIGTTDPNRLYVKSIDDFDGSAAISLTRITTGTITFDLVGKKKPGGGLINSPRDVVVDLLSKVAVPVGYDQASLDQFAIDAPYEIGLHIPDRINLLDILDQILPAGFFYGVEADGLFRISVMKPPQGLPDITLAEEDYEGTAEVDSEIVAYNVVNVGYLKNHTIQSDGLSPRVTAARRQYLKQAFKFRARAAHENVNSLSASEAPLFESLLEAQQYAQAEADRILALYSLGETMRIKTELGKFNHRLFTTVRPEVPSVLIGVSDIWNIVGIANGLISGKQQLTLWH